MQPSYQYNPMENNNMLNYSVLQNKKIKNFCLSYRIYSNSIKDHSNEVQPSQRENL